ncbi:Dynein light chain [Paragonimus heterotremus]|uniref:Dynein light chain n=1 Tax=Paragonimus heterotremus TaxID=100268 RepID=A0A8J4T1Y3_9TREM|nr:Dynein light chain [Paragonimus heterotremus]
MTEEKVVVLHAEMEFDTQEDAINVAKEAMKQCESPQDVPAYIKKTFDKKYQSSWHCVVGKNFCSYFTHEMDKFIFFTIRGHDVLLFKTPC